MTKELLSNEEIGITLGRIGESGIRLEKMMLARVPMVTAPKLIKLAYRSYRLTFVIFNRMFGSYSSARFEVAIKNGLANSKS